MLKALLALLFLVTLVLGQTQSTTRTFPFLRILAISNLRSVISVTTSPSGTITPGSASPSSSASHSPSSSHSASKSSSSASSSASASSAPVTGTSPPPWPALSNSFRPHVDWWNCRNHPGLLCRGRSLCNICHFESEKKESRQGSSSLIRQRSGPGVKFRGALQNLLKITISIICNAFNNVLYTRTLSHIPLELLR